MNEFNPYMKSQFPVCIRQINYIVRTLVSPTKRHSIRRPIVAPVWRRSLSGTASRGRTTVTTTAGLFFVVAVEQRRTITRPTGRIRPTLNARIGRSIAAVRMQTVVTRIGMSLVKYDTG